MSAIFYFIKICGVWQTYIGIMVDLFIVNKTGEFGFNACFLQIFFSMDEAYTRKQMNILYYMCYISKNEMLKSIYS